MFSKFELTNDGVNLLNRVIAEKKILKFTKFQLGKGDYKGDKKELSQLVDKFDEFNITQTNVLADGITNIRGFYDNRNLSIASKLTEIGIMAQLGDDSLTEVLFSYSNQPSTDAETVPSKENYFSRTFSVMNKTDNVTSVTFDLTIRQDKYNFGTLAEMKSADYLDVGDKVTLWGNSSLGDSSIKMYIITSETQTIQLNNKLYAKEYFSIYDGVDSASTTKVASAKAVKTAYDKANAAIPKTDIVNDLTTGGADKAGSAEMVKELYENSVCGIGCRTINKSTDLLTINKSGIYRADNVLVTQFTGYNGLDFYGYGILIVFQFNKSEHLTQMYIPHRSTGSIRGDILFRTVYSGADCPWMTLTTYDSKLLLGTLGVSKVLFIQDNGTKYKDFGYIDKDTGKVYRAKEQNTDVTVTSKFELSSNVENSKKIANLYETYSNGKTGYIKYSNGYCRQWGVEIRTGTNHEVTLPIAFKDTNFNVQATYHAGANITTQSIGISVSVINNQKISINKSENSSKWISWSVEGFWK